MGEGGPQSGSDEGSRNQAAMANPMPSPEVLSYVADMLRQSARLRTLTIRQNLPPQSLRPKQGNVFMRGWRLVECYHEVESD